MDEMIWWRKVGGRRRRTKARARLGRSQLWTGNQSIDEDEGRRRRRRKEDETKIIIENISDGITSPRTKLANVKDARGERSERDGRNWDNEPAQLVMMRPMKEDKTMQTGITKICPMTKSAQPSAYHDPSCQKFSRERQRKKGRERERDGQEHRKTRRTLISWSPRVS